MSSSFHLHLVSDASGEVADLLARATVAQLEEVTAEYHHWNMVRTRAQVDDVLAGVRVQPGFVLFTVVEPDIREALESGCKHLGVPCVGVLGPLVSALASHLGASIRYRPAARHVRDDDYFRRIRAMRFILSHDDGQMIEELDQADVIVLGVSRSSKTPLCVYLANRGIMAGNIPLIEGVPLPDIVTRPGGPLKVGLTIEPNVLIQLRRQRVKLIGTAQNTAYTDPRSVAQEVLWSRRLFEQHAWPVIDVTRRSIEEVAANILQLHEKGVDHAS